MPARSNHLIATGFYSGLSPLMPGSMGTLTAAALAWVCFLVVPQESSLIFGLCLASGTTAIGVLVSNAVLASGRYGAEAKDPREIVIDEFAGYYVSIIGSGGQLAPMLCAFVLFRVFDNWKPAPIPAIEKLPRGWGIMLDDVVAGIYSLVLTQMIFYLKVL